MSEGPWRGHVSFENNSSLKIFDRLTWKKKLAEQMVAKHYTTGIDVFLLAYLCIHICLICVRLFVLSLSHCM